jgi:transaldolase
VDGNTANQPLVRKVIERYLDRGKAATWAQTLKARRAGLSPKQLLPFLYAIVCGQIGNDIALAFASGRSWEVSLQLHMGLVGDPAAAKQIGRCLRRMAPSAFVKVPFAPHAPESFLVARDLEQEGIPVNFTSTFSARQAVAAGLLADVTRTNIFMGRLNQGLRAELLGEHVDLEAQRALRRLRRDAGIKTQLIVASMREWESFVRTAGCDVYTAPCGAIRDFLTQRDVSPDDIRSQLETSYADRLGIAEDVVHTLGQDRIARLYRVEPELVEFLREFAATREYQNLRDGDRLFRRFDQAGFGDLFYAPSDPEWHEIRRGKVPDLDSPITHRLPLDTLYSLMADADFERYQEEMDREIERRLLG